MCIQIGLQYEALVFVQKITNIGRTWNFEGMSRNISVPTGNMDKKEWQRGNVHITQHWGASCNQFSSKKAVKYSIFRECVRSASYPPCNTHAPYCHPWPFRLYYAFPHYLINYTIVEKNLLNIKSVFWFSPQILYEKIIILRRFQRDMIKHVYWSSRKISILFGRF